MAVLGFRKYARATAADPEGTDPQTWDAVADPTGIYPDDYVPRATGTRTEAAFFRVREDVDATDPLLEEDKLLIQESVTKDVIKDGSLVTVTVARRRRKVDIHNLMAEGGTEITNLIQAIFDTKTLYDYETNGVPEIPRALLMRHLQDKTKALVDDR